MMRVLLSMLLCACGPGARNAATVAPPVGGALRIEPAFSTMQYSAWAGASMWEATIAHGWTADSSTFVHCRAADWVTGRFTRGCMFVDAATNKTVRTIVSDEDYGAGHGARDESLGRVLDPLGFPTKPGLFRYADQVSLSWTAGDKELELFFVNDASKKRVSIASFHAEHLFPRDALISPNGDHLAIVVSHVGGPPLRTLSQVVSVDRAKEVL